MSKNKFVLPLEACWPEKNHSGYGGHGHHHTNKFNYEISSFYLKILEEDKKLNRKTIKA